MTIASLYEAVKIVVPVLSPGDTATKTAELVSLWDAALGALPGINDLVANKLTPGHLRGKYVYATGLGFEALGGSNKGSSGGVSRKMARHSDAGSTPHQVGSY